MYVIETEFENCNYDSFQNIKEEMYGKVIIQVKSSNNFPTLQSKVKKKQLLLDVLSNEVSKFKWLICSHINLELHW